MEALLNKLIQLSSNLVGQIGSCELEELDVYMEEREKLFDELHQFTPGSDQVAAYRPLVELIEKQDAVITGRMTVLRNEANHEIDKINRGKRSKSMYESSSFGDDSLFFDTKR